LHLVCGLFLVVHLAEDKAGAVNDADDEKSKDDLSTTSSLTHTSQLFVILLVISFSGFRNMISDIYNFFKIIWLICIIDRLIINKGEL